MTLRTVSFALIAVALVVLVGWYALPSQAGSGVKLDLLAPTFATTGQTFGVNLDARNVQSPGLGTWTIDVTYPISGVTFVNCTPKESTSCTPFDGNVRFSGFTFQGLTEVVEIGNIIFRAGAPGQTNLGLEVFVLADLDSTDLTIGMDTNVPTINITSDAAAGSPTPSVTPTATATPALGTIILDVAGPDGSHLPGFSINLFEGDACQGSPIASGATAVVYNPFVNIDETLWRSPAVPGGPYSASIKPRPGWRVVGPLCKDVLLGVVGMLNLAVVEFEVAAVANGDVNSDDVTNSIDALVVLQANAGLVVLEELDSIGQFRADVNLDEIINAIDAQLILQFDAGFILSLPLGD